MTELPENFKAMIDEQGIEAAPVTGLDTFVFRANGITKRLLDYQLDEMTEEDFHIFLAGFEPPQPVAMKSEPIVEWFLAQRQLHSPITGHFRGGDR